MLKKAITTVLIFCITLPAFGLETADSIKCLEQLNEKDFKLRVEHYCHIITLDTSSIILTEQDYVKILKIINTINAYSKNKSYDNEIDIYRRVIPKIIESLAFIEFPDDGAFCEKYNLFIGGQPRATSIYWITDWEYTFGFPPIINNCDCMFPPCD